MAKQTMEPGMEHCSGLQLWSAARHHGMELERPEHNARTASCTFRLWAAAYGNAGHTSMTCRKVLGKQRLRATSDSSK